MRLVHAALLLLVTGSPALAQRIPTIVIPGRLDVPVVINGVDASWSVVEGDYGLDRPIGMAPSVIYRPFTVVVPGNGPFGRPPKMPVYGPRYFPSTGERPGYGRLEVVPPPDRPLPPPAESFFQGWSAQSAPGPATVYAPFPAPQILWNAGRGWGPHPPGPRPPFPPRGGPPPAGPPGPPAPNPPPQIPQ